MPLQYPAAQYRLVSWKDLPGWQEDPLEDAWQAWLKSCQYLSRLQNSPAWTGACDRAKNISSQALKNNQVIRTYFETYFQVWEITQAKHNKQFAVGSPTGLITGYFEPTLKGSMTKQGPYQTPLHRFPESWQSNPNIVRPPRKDLLNSNTLHGQEIVWVEDPVAAAMMQIQGSGRILLENQQILRLSFAGTNQQRYQSIAQWLIDRKELTAQQASMQSISEWAKKNPQRINELLDANPRYVFFKILRDQLSVKDGPVGSIGVSLTPGRSIAVDWQAIPKGAPMFLSTTDPDDNKPIKRMVFAQDTGSAIVGGVRADYFWGSDGSAGMKAGKMKQVGRVWAILPHQLDVR
jgi:membrane-bound lytic murein transglycosylase A